MNNVAGVYLNLVTKKMVRVQAMPGGPFGSEWVKVTDDANAGVRRVREIARAQGLVLDSEAIQWDINLEAIKKAVGVEVTTWPQETLELPLVA